LGGGAQDATQTDIDGGGSRPQIYRGSAGAAGHSARETGVATNRNDGRLYYRHHVFCCTNERSAGNPKGCCSRKGATGLRTYMKTRARALGLGDVRINAAGCLDRCEQGPTLVVYPEGIWYRAETREDIDEILEVHIRGGGTVERLRLDPAADKDAGKGD
jgi:(2Fe-2S) ferredoxin